MQHIVQIRNVPEAVHRKLRVRAAEKGQSLTQYLQEELRRIAERPTAAEMKARLARITPVGGDFSTADFIRADRDSH